MPGKTSWPKTKRSGNRKRRKNGNGGSPRISFAAREKLAADQKKDQERTANEPQMPATKPKKSAAIGAAKKSSFAVTSKTPTYRRTGG